MGQFGWRADQADVAWGGIGAREDGQSTNVQGGIGGCLERFDAAEGNTNNADALGIDLWPGGEVAHRQSNFVVAPEINQTIRVTAAEQIDKEETVALFVRGESEVGEADVAAIALTAMNVEQSGTIRS